MKLQYIEPFVSSHPVCRLPEDLIILEAASRLQRAWSITPEQMDRMTVFPRSLLSQPEVSPGLIHQGLQRYYHPRTLVLSILIKMKGLCSLAIWTAHDFGKL